MKVRATTTGRHENLGHLWVQGRLEAQWEPGGPWLRIVVATYEMTDWILTVLVWSVASREGAFDFEHNDIEDDDRDVPQEEASGSNA